MKHHPDCEPIPFVDVVNGLLAPGEAWPAQIDPEFAKEAITWKCHEECPRVIAGRIRGEELAERFGWP